MNDSTTFMFLARITGLVGKEGRNGRATLSVGRRKTDYPSGIIQ